MEVTGLIYVMSGRLIASWELLTRLKMISVLSKPIWEVKPNVYAKG